MPTTTAFAALAVCGLDYTFTLADAVGVLRLVSTPSHFWAWLGIGILQRSPNLKDYILEVSFQTTQFPKSHALPLSYWCIKVII